MAITGYVVDKYGNILTDDDLSKKVITQKSYYDLVLPIRKRLNEELAKQRGRDVA